MAGGPVGGKVFLTVNGARLSAKGTFTYRVQTEKRETVVGADSVHGYSEMPQAAFIAGEITDRPDLKLADLAAMTDVTVQLSLANGKAVVLRNAWYVEAGEVSSDEGSIAVRWESDSGEELT